ncbi:MAG TPA: hypothetical protein VNM67_23275 [Thermoanaerobaculia bacterium]|nr:hypothetical protein [Thermoanaerobaculia bacterium]
MSRGLRLAALAAALYLAGVLVWVRYDRRSAQEAFSPGSVFNTGEEGLSLAFAYLRERSSANTLHRRIEPADLPANGVVLRVQPLLAPILLQEKEKDEKEPKDEKDGKDKKNDEEGPVDELQRKIREEEERRAKEEKEQRKKAGIEEEPPLIRLLSPDEEAWVRGGGRLVLAFVDGYGSGSTEELQGKQPVRKVFPLWPGVANLAPPTARSLALPPLPGGHAVFLAGKSPLVVRQVLGAGDVIFLATPEIFQNLHLGQAHHLALLEALAGVPERRPILFDERSHLLDDSGGILDILAGWGLGPLLLLGLIATGAAFWRSAKRLGPPEREERKDLETRSDAVELLDSLADLYDRALQRGDAVFLFYESFTHTVAVETGLRGKALEERSKALLDGYVPIKGEELSRERFDQALRTINQAFRRLQDAKRK